MTRVYDLEAACHQLATGSPSLHGGVDAKPGKVPVRVLWMGYVHLVQN